MGGVPDDTMSAPKSHPVRTVEPNVARNDSVTPSGQHSKARPRACIFERSRWLHNPIGTTEKNVMKLNYKKLSA